MANIKKSQAGFGHIELIIAVLFIGIIAFVGVRMFKDSKAATPLTWAPPALVNPTTVYVTNSAKNLKLDPTKDYIVKMPSTPVTGKGPVNIYGGHNVVLIGGEVRHDTNYGGDAGKDQRGFYLQEWTGTMHIEGVWISGSELGEGIDVGNSNTGSTLQLENIRIETVHGTQATNHADIIQNWGGPVTYRIDHLTGSSTYQGFFVQSSKFGPTTQTLDFRNVNVYGVNGGGRYLFYNATGLTTANVKLTNVWSKPNYPNAAVCGCYPEKDPVWAAIQPGSPSTGDFVPLGVAGTGYKSPGYGTTTSTTTGGATTPTTPTTPPTTPTTPPAPTTPVKIVNQTFDGSTTMQQILGGWTVANSTYTITTVKDAPSGNGNIAIYPTSISGNYTIDSEATLPDTTSTFDDFSILFGYTDKNNYYYASFNESNDGGTNGIFKVQNGTITEIKDFTNTIKTATKNAVSITKNGTTYTVKVNGAVYGSVNDATFSAGKVGLGSRNNAVSFHNLVVTQ